MQYEQLRPIVFDYLRANLTGQVNLHGDNFARTKAQQSGLEYTDDDGFRVIEIFHELYREGVIVSGADPTSIGQSMTWPFYRVTEYGRQVLAEKDYVPHDSDGYLSRIRKAIRDVDSIIIRYLEEAFGCFKANHMLAAAVMTGCAAEKAMLLMISAFGAALTDDDERKKFESVIARHWMIGRKFDEFWKRLQRKLIDLPGDLADDLHVTLDRVFDLIRSTRNDAGHPTGKQVDRNTVSANFILFPTYCTRMFSLMKHFREHGI